MRTMAAVGVVLSGIVLAAASPRGVVAQAVSGERVQAGAPVPAVPAAAAQVVAPAVATPSGTEPSAVARFGPSAAGAELLAPVRAQAAQRELAHEPAYRGNAPGVALMIVGGALFLGGAIVGDRAGDALMVGGVVVAALGLYQYLQ